MNEAIAYYQSDLCDKLKAKAAFVTPPLLEAIETFDYDACEKDAKAIENFVCQCLRGLYLLAALAPSLAQDDKIDDDLADWLFNLSRTIDAKIIGSPVFAEASITPGNRAALEDAAASFAEATCTIDMNACKEIKDVLTSRGFVKND